MTPREAAIALNLIPGLGPVRIMRLLQVFASPELILESPSSLLMEIPGVGAQGGDAVATVRAGWRPGAPIIVNSSRAILYASPGDDFAEAARREALKTRDVLQAARA